MAVRGWGGSIATAIGVAAGAGAAQLGLGYGLGIIAWLPSVDGASEAAWVASLTWAAWIAATSTVAGAICAARLAGPAAGESAGARPDAATGTLTLWRVALGLASAVGGLVTVALIAVPARAATRADTFSPQTIAAGYAVIGVLVGLLVAVWALTSPAVANNVIATVCWLWFLALVAVIASVISGRGLTGAQLGVWQITSDSSRFWFRNYFYWPGAALSLGSALVIGVFAARSAARRPWSRVGAAASGGVGPLLVAVSYFLAAPRLVGIRAEQMSAHLMAPYAVIAGLAGSVLVAALAQRAENLGRTAGTPGTADDRSAPTDPTAARGTDGAAVPDASGAGTSTGAAVGAGQLAGAAPADPAPADRTETGTDQPGAGRSGAGRRSASTPAQRSGRGDDSQAGDARVRGGSAAELPSVDRLPGAGAAGSTDAAGQDPVEVEPSSGSRSTVATADDRDSGGQPPADGQTASGARRSRGRRSR